MPLNASALIEKRQKELFDAATKTFAQRGHAWWRSMPQPPGPTMLVRDMCAPGLPVRAIQWDVEKQGFVVVVSTLGCNSRPLSTIDLTAPGANDALTRFTPV